MKRQKTLEELGLIPWSPALQERLNHLPPLSAEEDKRIREKAEEQVRRAVEAGEQERLWIKENLDAPNASPIEAFVAEAERQWETIREYQDPMAIQLLLDEQTLLERMEERRRPALREAESRASASYLVGLIDDFIRIHKEFLEEARRDWEELPAGVDPDQWEDRPQECPLGVIRDEFYEALTRLKGHIGEAKHHGEVKRGNATNAQVVDGKPLAAAEPKPPTVGAASTQDVIPESEADWPPAEGWGFRSGEAAYNGTPIRLNGIDWKLFQALVEQDGPLTVDELRDFGWAPEAEPETKTIRTHLSQLRKLLRRKLELKADFDPIPCCDRGKLLAWKLHPNLR